MAKGKKYKNPDDLEAAIEAYFSECIEKKKRPTKPGLAYSLGFADRQSLYDYKEYGEAYSCLIKRATLLIEDCLCQFDSSMAIFQLKAYYGLSDGSNKEQDRPDTRITVEFV